MSSKKTNDLVSLVEFGLDSVSSSEKVEMPLKDLLYVFQTLQEYQRFFHQRLHYPTVEDIHKFLESGGYETLKQSIHSKLRDVFPDYVEEMFNNGQFDSDESPYYFGSEEWNITNQLTHSLRSLGRLLAAASPFSQQVVARYRGVIHHPFFSESQAKVQHFFTTALGVRFSFWSATKVTWNPCFQLRPLSFLAANKSLKHWLFCSVLLP